MDQEVVDFQGDMANLGEGEARDTCESCTNFQIWKQLNNSFEGQGGVKKSNNFNPGLFQNKKVPVHNRQGPLHHTTKGYVFDTLVA